MKCNSLLINTKLNIVQWAIKKERNERINKADKESRILSWIIQTKDWDVKSSKKDLKTTWFMKIVLLYLIYIQSYEMITINKYI